MDKKKFAFSFRLKNRKKKLYKYYKYKNMSHKTIFYPQDTPTSQSHFQNNSYSILRIGFREH